MHFPPTDNLYDAAFPPAADALETVVATTAPRRATTRAGRLLRASAVLTTSFTLVFGVLYVTLTWPLTLHQTSYYLSQLSGEQEEIAVAATPIADADSDADGYTDGAELAAGFDPNNPTPVRLDADGDGIKDAIEQRYYGTDPLAADSDGDGFNDLTEITNGFSPLRPADYERWVEDRSTAVLRISKISVDAPVVWNESLDAIYDDLERGVVHYRRTANPGEVGNTVLIGHSSQFIWDDNKFGTVFALLDKLEAGDKIDVDYMGKTYTYAVTDSDVTKPTDTSRFAATSKPTITLVSCFPAGSNDLRIFVTAELVGAAPIDRSEQP